MAAGKGEAHLNCPNAFTRALALAGRHDERVEREKHRGRRSAAA
jgi:hypothetical protein